jgi:senataxin
VKAIRLRDEILLGIQTAEEGPVSNIPSVLPMTFSAFLDEKLNRAQRVVIDSVCGFTHQYKPRVVLVRGPPGSGKTLTLHSVLNAQHVQQFNAYYDSIVAAVKAGRMTTSERSWLDLASVAKPRIIVCAPSNVAIDNIILRILSDQFVGGDGNNYMPWLVRIGKGSMQHQEVAKKALSRMVDEIVNMAGPELVSNITKLEGLYSELRQGVLLELSRLQCMIAGSPYPFEKGIETRIMVNAIGQFVPYWVDHGTASSLTELPPPAAAESPSSDPVEQMPEWILYCKELMRLLELWEAVHWELQRFRLVRSYIQNSMGAPNSAAASAEKYQLQANLETLLMNQATIVCGTLNSTALPQVKQSLEFQTCVVDEAAQAVELSTLIPLQLGVKQLVLVGDPQQLPATVLAKRELIGNYERSLFERLEHCGVPVHTLDVQYRMHPAISVFPRLQFYQGILRDSQSVARISPFFSKPPYNLNPFVFIDVVSGRDITSQQTQSRSNSDEAAVCVSLYFALLRIANEQGNDLKKSVGIISPYSEQVRVLKQTFEAAGIKSAGHLDDIEIATVDSFQGKEKDIIILSTVRGCPESNSLGFLADVRRMNVALTRARMGLFVVGKTQTLQVNEQWSSLILHAKQTKNGYIQVKGAGEDMYDVFASSFFGSRK